MKGNWQTFKLSEVVDKFIDYRGKTPTKTSSGVPLITAKIVKGGFLSTPEEFIAEEDYDSWMQRGLPLEGDVVMTTEAPLGEIAQIKGNTRVALAQRIITLRGKKGVLDNTFLRYSLQSPTMQHRLHSRASGSTVQGIKSAELRQVEIDLPAFHIQHRIADILGALDDKIECNRRISKTLEAMAQTLYKHWFVDFGPFRGGEFVDSELGQIPNGWEIQPIGEVIETFGGGTPSTSNPDYWKNGDINWYVPSDLTRVQTLFISESSKKINRKGLAGSAAHLFPSYSVMMTSRATIGEISINRTEACTNQGFIALVPNDKVSLYQIVFWLRQSMEKILGMSHGTTFKEITRGTLRAFPILIAKDPVLYVSQSKALFDQIESYIVESAILTRTRDYLLPKLLSGEVEIKNADSK